MMQVDRMNDENGDVFDSLTQREQLSKKDAPT